MTDQPDLLARAARVLPGGVLGSHRSGAGLEFVVKDARGRLSLGRDGRRYIDYLLGSGPMLLGHSHPAVVEAVQRQLAPRHDVHAPERADHRAGRGDRARGARRRAGAVHVERIGGDVLRAPRGARVPAARQDHEVRGRLPRHPRLRAHERESRARRRRSRRPWPTPPASRTRSARRCSSRRTTTWPPPRRSSPRTTTSWPR